MKSTTHICTKCQRPREVGGGCYTFCNGKNFLPIPEEKPQNILNLINQIKHEQTMRRKSIKDTRNMDRNTQTIIMDTITKELFDNYLKLQRSGIMNMTDIEQGARILRCTQDEYETILWNYTALKNKFYPKSK